MIWVGLFALCLGPLVGESEPARALVDPAAKGPVGGAAASEVKQVTEMETEKSAAVPPAPAESQGAGTEQAEKIAAEPVDPDDEGKAEDEEAQKAAVARPVSPDLIQVFGWKEHVYVNGLTGVIQAKLDTGALTSSIHAEEEELFERDGKKWVRFVVTDPRDKKSARNRIEAPLVRIAMIKEPGGVSLPREVVKLSLQIGGRKLRGEFTLNNRSNMLSPVLIGRNMIKDLGWVDSTRTFIADEKILR